MASIRVHHTIGGLQRDLATISTTARAKMVPVVKRNVEQGNELARRFARASSGLHGINYYKRITGELTGPLVGEYGPHGDVRNNAVGAGWRNGPPNTDLARSADIQGPLFAKDVGDTADGMFWP